MSIKTIFVGPFFDASMEAHAPDPALTRYAIDLAASEGAHLSIRTAVSKLSAPSITFMGEVRALVNKANAERLDRADSFRAEAERFAQASGVSVDSTAVQDDFIHLVHAFSAQARLADIAVMQACDEFLSMLRGATEEVLFNSGGPVIVTPLGWSGPAQPVRALIAWDGGPRASRALRDAMPLLSKAAQVEIVTISGDPNPAKRIEGAEIAPRVARHCRDVRLTNLPAARGDVGEALRAHATMTRADLVVMGAFAHNRFRQMVLGGVTRHMLEAPPVPTLMSY
jgi:nucleotide-binding universal stress UspA family protein